jgi:hypothetical protein
MTEKSKKDLAYFVFLLTAIGMSFWYPEQTVVFILMTITYQLSEMLNAIQ